MNVVGADGGNGGFFPAVHIHKRLETVLFAGAEKPVNRPFLINFAMVGIETVQQITAYHLTGRTLAAKGICDEFQVFVKRVLAISFRHEIHDQPSEVGGQVIVVAYWQNVVLDGNYRLVFRAVPLTACVGKPLDIEGISAKPTAHGIAYQAFYLTL